MLTLAKELTAEGNHVAALLSMEQGAPFSNDPGAAELTILASWRRATEAWLPPELQPPPWPDTVPGARIGAALSAWAQAAPRPLVVFLDEIDALRDETLLSVLRQIRGGFPTRPSHFPQSLALIGLRDVRDYKVSAAHEGRLGTASPFNIKAESLTLRDFTQPEVAQLLTLHTDESGQPFTTDAVDRAFELSQGQPWLINALARQLTQVLVRDRAQTITIDHVDDAKELLIRRQDTHLDSLMDRLREPRIRAILEPMLAGTVPGELPEDDRRFVLDLGLLRRSPLGGLEVANPIYREIIVRALASGPSDALPQLPTTWLTPRLPKESSTRTPSSRRSWRSGVSTASPCCAPRPTTRSLLISS